MALKELKGPVVLEIPSDPASLFVVRALVSKLSERIGFAGKEIDGLVLAVDEACANVIRHAYRNSPEGKIVLTFLVAGDRFEIRIRDFGTPGDPATFQPRSLDDIRPGGLGVHLIRAVADKVEYGAPPGGGMLLTIVKFRPKPENASP